MVQNAFLGLQKHFEFLLIERPHVNYTILENIQYTIGPNKEYVNNIEDQIMIINTTIVHTQTRLSSMENDVYKNI